MRGTDQMHANILAAIGSYPSGRVSRNAAPRFIVW